jgi:hypothetical protein
MSNQPNYCYLCHSNYFTNSRWNHPISPTQISHNTVSTFILKMQKFSTYWKMRPDFNRNSNNVMAPKYRNQVPYMFALNLPQKFTLRIAFHYLICIWLCWVFLTYQRNVCYHNAAILHWSKADIFTWRRQLKPHQFLYTLPNINPWFLNLFSWIH